jgi:hypothetical protein
MSLDRASQKERNRRKVMNLKKILLVMVALACLCTPAFAGEQPEYDVVGCDADAFFNDWLKYLVCQKNTLTVDVTLNEAGSFCELFLPDAQPFDCGNLTGDEWFDPPSLLTPDTCFEFEIHGGGIIGALTSRIGAGNGGVYRWRIVLQKKPESDLNINIVDCVVKMNSSTMFGTGPFEGAGQTGLRVYPWGQLEFVKDDNPSIMVHFFPGEFADAGLPATGYAATARTLPELGDSSLAGPNGQLYTSKGPWTEGIVIKRPNFVDDGFALRQGDMVEVTITVPPTNTMDVRYGLQSVIIEYVGIHGAIYFNRKTDGSPLFCNPCDVTVPAGVVGP